MQWLMEKLGNAVHFSPRRRHLCSEDDFTSTGRWESEISWWTWDAAVPQGERIVKANWVKWIREIIRLHLHLDSTSLKQTSNNNKYKSTSGQSKKSMTSQWQQLESLLHSRSKTISGQLLHPNKDASPNYKREEVMTSMRLWSGSLTPQLSLNVKSRAASIWLWPPVCCFSQAGDWGHWGWGYKRETGCGGQSNEVHGWVS